MTVGTLVHLTEQVPQMTPDEMVRALVPPPQFAHASFENYVPDESYPSQMQAVEISRDFAKAGETARAAAASWQRCSSAHRR